MVEQELKAKSRQHKGAGRFIEVRLYLSSHNGFRASLDRAAEVCRHIAQTRPYSAHVGGRRCLGARQAGRIDEFILQEEGAG